MMVRTLIYIDRHLLNEVTSPQAFEELQLANRAPWRLSANIASPDHNVPTVSKERLEGVSGIKRQSLAFASSYLR